MLTRLQAAMSRERATHCLRFLSSQRHDTIAPNIFDRNAKLLHRNRITRLKDFKVYDYLKEEIGFRIYDRMCDIKREFNIGLELGCGRGYVSRHLTKDMVNIIYQMDMSSELLAQSEVSADVPTCGIVGDEESFPFSPNTLNIVYSCLSLHWVNDLPRCFDQVHSALQSDGAFIGCMFAGDTLFELRSSLQKAETELEGGFGPHVSPLIRPEDLGGLLNQAGFTLITLDIDELVFCYPSMFELMTDLQGMAENNCAWTRKSPLHRKTMKRAAEIYKENYGNERGVPATYQVLYFIGWKADPSQVRPAERGSGEVSFKDLSQLEQLIREQGMQQTEKQTETTTMDKDKET